MRDLSSSEIGATGGGTNPLIAVGLGIAGAYIYDTIGGKEGIDSAISTTASTAASGANSYINTVGSPSSLYQPTMPDPNKYG